jgi:putative membrane protein
VSAVAAPSALVLALMGSGSGLGIVWGPGMALFWIAVIAVIIVALRAAAGRPNGGAERSALEVLEERYARGEITRDEFLDRRAVLTDAGRQRHT